MNAHNLPATVDVEELYARLLMEDSFDIARRWAAARKSWEFGDTRDGEGEQTNAKPGNAGKR